MGAKWRETRSLCWSTRIGVVFSLITTVSAGSAIAAELSSAQIYASAAPAVVLIATGNSAGTGSIIDDKGLVLTNAHVIMNDEKKTPHERILVFLKPDRVVGDFNNQDNLARRHEARVVAYDETLDLALLKIVSLPSSLPVLVLADPEGTIIGSRVLAIGHPERGGLWTLTTGVISAEWKDYATVSGWDIFQTETSLNRGNSGGPLVNEFGQQIGINTFIQRRAADGLAITSINFAVKSNVAKDWLARKGVYVAYAPSAKGPGVRDSIQESQPGPKESGDRDPFPKKFAPKPDKVLENQPEAKPETGPGLPPLRPYSIDTLLKRLDLVQKDLEKQMDDMGAEIEKRRRR